jgi:hypothetical protein
LTAALKKRLAVAAFVVFRRLSFSLESAEKINRPKEIPSDTKVTGLRILSLFARWPRQKFLVRKFRLKRE